MPALYPAVTVLRLPYYTYSYMMKSNNASVSSPLAQNSLLLLLVLLHYRKGIYDDDNILKGLTDDNGNDAVSGLQDTFQTAINPFCQALDLARDTDCKYLDFTLKS